MPGTAPPSPIAPRPLREILAAGERFLAAHGAQEPRAGVEWLAARLYGCGRLDLRLRADEPVPGPLLEAMRRGVRRLAAGEPVQHIVGRWEFHGHPVKTDRRALIPRPETERLVDLVLEDSSLWDLPAPRIVDVGTGTGCIALSLALERPQGRYLATDASADALSLARENAVLNRVDSVRFAECTDLSELLDPGSVDAIVSNPPYIPSAAVDALERSVRDFEPRLALDGGPDGMVVLRDIAEQAAMALADGGRLFLELDAESGQAPKMAVLLRDLGFEAVAAHHDYAGRERFLSARLAAGL